MKHLDGDKCFMELTRVDCALIVEYLGHSADWYKEHGITGETFQINEYAKKFKSMYGNITIKEEIERR